MLSIYTLLAIGCLLFLILFGLARICCGKKGTWSEALAPDKPTWGGTSSFPAPLESSGKESAGETRVKNFLKSYFPQNEFRKTRPMFLNNVVTGNNLELDCYNQELNLAIEYNGRQHYHYTPYFHPNKEAFYNQRYRDELKKIWCKDRGIILLVVPYTEKNIEQYLTRELHRLRL